MHAGASAQRRWVCRSSWRSSRCLRPREQFGEVVIHTCHPEVRFALKGLAQVVGAVCVVAGKLDDGEDEIFRLVEGVENLVSCNSDRRRAYDTTFHLDETQLASAGDAT